MRVVKVLNNSLVLALDDQGQENILMGKGIGFHKATGYEFGKDEVEKVFVLKDRSISRSIIKLAAEVDTVYFEIVKHVVDYAIDHFGMKLQDHIYLALVDHLAFAVRRVEQGIEVPNFYTADMRRFNPDEFLIGLYAIRLVREECSVILPEDEAGNIAFHFINAQFHHPYNDKNIQIRQVTANVLDIVKYFYQLVYMEDSVAYARYVRHVQLFAQRLISHKQLDGDSSHLIYDQIAKVCESEFKCVEKIGMFVREQFGEEVTGQEGMYLAMHIHLILEERGKR